MLQFRCSGANAFFEFFIERFVLLLGLAQRFVGGFQGLLPFRIASHHVIERADDGREFVVAGGLDKGPLAID